MSLLGWKEGVSVWRPGQQDRGIEKDGSPPLVRMYGVIMSVYYATGRMSTEVPEGYNGLIGNIP